MKADQAQAEGRQAEAAPGRHGRAEAQAAQAHARSAASWSGSEIEAELKAKCGPIGAGGKCKFDECGLSCKPTGEAGPLKTEPDKVGVKMSSGGGKAVLEGTKCSFGGKLAGRICRAWRNSG